jgi:regulator of nucleoside diphosphate kinase
MDRVTCRLTSKDFSILEVMLERRIASEDRILPLLKCKLANASVVVVDSIEADVATLNSRVVFRINGAPAETRTLVQNDVRGTVGTDLPVTTLRGLALLGLKEGQSAMVELATGETQLIRLEKVLYQPEAARRRFAPKPASKQASVPPAGRPALRLVHSAPADVTPLGERPEIRHRGPYDDDPGPSAA